MAMDIVFLHGLKVDAVIGIWDWERQFRQTLIIDLDMGTDIGAAARSDAIEDTIDYKSVTKRVMHLAETSGCLLVERLAQMIADTLFAEFGILWVKVRINKKSAVRQVRDVGVQIERSRPA
jgi:dihydroneopterin aldolase